MGCLHAFRYSHVCTGGWWTNERRYGRTDERIATTAVSRCRRSGIIAQCTVNRLPRSVVPTSWAKFKPYSFKVCMVRIYRKGKEPSLAPSVVILTKTWPVWHIWTQYASRRTLLIATLIMVCAVHRRQKQHAAANTPCFHTRKHSA